MVKMSDIFKKALESQSDFSKLRPKRQESKEKKEVFEKGLPKEDIVKSAKPVKSVDAKISFSEIKKESESNKGDIKEANLDVNTSQFMKKKLGNLNDEEIDILYKDAVALIADICGKLKDNKDTAKEDKVISNYLEKFINLQIQNDDRILSLLHLSDKDYPYDQVINVCLMAIEIGVGLGFGKSELISLSVAAFLHKIGMVNIYQLGSKVHKGQKANSSFSEDKTSVDEQFIVKFENIADKFITSAYHDLENMSQIGYPKDLDDEVMFDYSRIIGLADLYEVWAYPGNQYGKMFPHEVLSLIIRIKNSFGENIVKAFIERISCPFPVGIYVKLSSGEEAQVIGRNLGYPLNPRVEVCDEDSDRPKDERVVDLREYPTIHIQSYLKK